MQDETQSREGVGLTLIGIKERFLLLHALRCISKIPSIVVYKFI